MRHHPRLTRLGSTLAGGLLLNATALASGLILYEIATPDAALSGAGAAARAGDAATVFTNPAGMSQLEEAQFLGGLQVLYGSVSFTPDAATSPRLGAGDGGNALGWLPAASTFVVVPLGEKWRAGFGALSYFGLAEEFDENWVGRYYVQKGTLLGLSLTPSLSYAITDWLSLGGGLNAMYGVLDTEVAVNNGVGPDGQMALKDQTWGFGGNVGVLVKVGEKTRLGVTYLSPVDLDFRDTPAFSGLGPGLSVLLANPAALDLGMTVPQTVMLSGYRTLSDRWALLANVGWQNWNDFGYVEAGVEHAGTTTLDLAYQDTWHGALGAQYQASRNWLLSGGFAYDSSPVDSEDRTVTLPLGEQWRFSLGAQYQLSRSLSVGAATTFLWAGDLAVDQGDPSSLRGRVSGAFDDAWFVLMNLNLNWKF